MDGPLELQWHMRGTSQVQAAVSEGGVPRSARKGLCLGLCPKLPPFASVRAPGRVRGQLVARPTQSRPGDRFTRPLSSSVTAGPTGPSGLLPRSNDRVLQARPLSSSRLVAGRGTGGGGHVQVPNRGGPDGGRDTRCPARRQAPQGPEGAQRVPRAARPRRPAAPRHRPPRPPHCAQRPRKSRACSSQRGRTNPALSSLPAAMQSADRRMPMPEASVVCIIRAC